MKYKKHMLLLMAFSGLSPAATIGITLNQFDLVSGGSSVNLTTQGNLDWGIWTGSANGGAPTESFDGGVGFNSFALNSGTNGFSSTFTAAQNLYSWTNGTAATVGTGSALGHQRLRANAAGEGLSLTIDVSAAGDYQFQFYSVMAEGVNFEGTASLVNAGISDAVTGTSISSPIQNFYYTVDFTTDGADTLVFDLARTNQGAATVDAFAIEAFTLAAVPEPSSSALFGFAGLALMLRRRR